MVLLTLLVLGAVFAPYVTPFSPTQIALGDKLSPPTLAHPFGTDHFGRDMLTRVLYGARISLSVGLVVVLIAGSIGASIGLIAGYFGGWLDNILMRVMDAFLTFPPLLLAVALMGTLGVEVRNVMLALALVYVPVFARLARSSTLSIREEAYVAAGVALGSTSARVLTRHLLPNMIAPVLIQGAVIFSRAILAEAALSFLGLGVQPPDPSWGRDLNEARRFLDTAPWLVAFPTLMIGLSVLSVNFIGDGLRDALDPRGSN